MPQKNQSHFWRDHQDVLRGFFHAGYGRRGRLLKSYWPFHQPLSNPPNLSNSRTKSTRNPELSHSVNKDHQFRRGTRTLEDWDSCAATVESFRTRDYHFPHGQPPGVQYADSVPHPRFYTGTGKQNKPSNLDSRHGYTQNQSPYLFNNPSNRHTYCCPIYQNNADPSREYPTQHSLPRDIRNEKRRVGPETSKPRRARKWSPHDFGKLTEDEWLPALGSTPYRNEDSKCGILNNSRRKKEDVCTSVNYEYDPCVQCPVCGSFWGIGLDEYSSH